MYHINKTIYSSHDGVIVWRDIPIFLLHILIFNLLSRTTSVTFTLSKPQHYQPESGDTFTVPHALLCIRGQCPRVFSVYVFITT